MIDLCLDELREGREWPPTVAKAQIMLSTRSRTEIQQAFRRWESGTPQGRPERWVFQRFSWNLKRVDAGKELGEFAKQLKRADELERANQLQLDEETLAMLPVHSSVSMTDRLREDFSRSGKAHAFSDRIKRMMKEKKANEYC